MILTIEGIDRTGKDTLHRYIERLSNFKYVINTRGIMTQLAYNKKFNRDYTYHLKEYEGDIIVYLYAEPEDLEVRFKMTNEPKLNDGKTLREGIEDDLKLFQDISHELADRGFIILKYNTTEDTPYTIARRVISELEYLEKEGIIKV